MTDTPPLVQRVTIGAYAASEPWPDLAAHYTLESAMGVKLPTMSWFQSWQNGWLATQSAVAAASGHALQIALEPVHDDRTPVLFAEILAGVWNTRLDRYFAGAAAHPFTVAIRMAHEMNLGQQRWSLVNPTPCATSLNQWLDTWRYVVDRQRNIGGNVKWIWCVNSMDLGGVAAESYWPGADYVDILAIDAYNGYGPWTSAARVIKPMYDRITTLHPTAPVWLSEVGCRSVAQGEPWSKAQWYADLLTTSLFPRMTNVMFFNSAKEYDWRITGDDVHATLAALLVNARSVAR